MSGWHAYSESVRIWVAGTPIQKVWGYEWLARLFRKCEDIIGWHAYSESLRIRVAGMPIQNVWGYEWLARLFRKCEDMKGWHAYSESWNIFKYLCMGGYRILLENWYLYPRWRRYSEYIDNLDNCTLYFEHFKLLKGQLHDKSLNLRLWAGDTLIAKDALVSIL